ncbi:hypothetical protein O6H91_08G055600 [Diphasiastrum complanatum]|uniref:Uncharacterized protein n=2 Tax=Diphasiastrum complanatum TaxID=34168 RepID=A0ACC2CYS0_DIPCM|nr:hypothetical protein O6H91_Y360300 [Diphasiastrum complanatum]KAJ7282124.1 hypothetical protein O6H91_Y360300 [Diphasiastrum complanatum]KAJ7546812.1 hypothetical protein O6H91_08G055600 [Diphasiastrum complanatum]KAJ7546813.1 hypothetical protein O6H91_08G055600 [Diphasiastrum complanatum]
MVHRDDNCQTVLQIPIEPSKNAHAHPDEEYDDDGHPRRIGNLWTASAHIITAVIGSGVLSLAWSFAQMGWIAGPVVLAFFAIVTYWTSLFLINCYRHPDPVYGKRNYIYMDAVRANLGPVQVWLCGFVQYTNLWATAIGYTITASTSMVMWWLSIVAAIMSLCYASIGLGLGIQRAIENGSIPVNHFGIDTSGGLDQLSRMTKVWQILQALGNIAFAYSYSAVLIEIQDTLKNPPSEKITMKRATLIGVSITTFFYMTIGCVGYAAFGNSAPGNLLTGFGFFNPYWLIDFANICIFVHLVGAYQVFCQPLFALVENWVERLWPDSRFIHKNYVLTIPTIGALQMNLFRSVWRSLFVTMTTLVAALLPFFNAIVGLIGAYGFWPLTVYFPISMYINQQRIKPWSLKWILLQILSITCFLVSMAAGIGSMKGIFEALKHYTPFETRY